MLEARWRNAEALRHPQPGGVAERWAAINRSYEDAHVKILKRSGGTAPAFGQKEEVLRKVLKP